MILRTVDHAVGLVKSVDLFLEYGSYQYIMYLDLDILMHHAVRHSVMTVHHQSETRSLGCRAVGSPLGLTGRIIVASLNAD